MPLSNSFYRSQEEDVQLDDETLDTLTTMAASTSLRYSLNLIAPAKICATQRKSHVVGVVDLRRAYKLFTDVKRSAEFIQSYRDQLMSG